MKVSGECQGETVPTSREPVTVFVRGGHQSWSTAKGQALPCVMFTVLHFTKFGKILLQTEVLIREGQREGIRNNQTKDGGRGPTPENSTNVIC